MALQLHLRSARSWIYTISFLASRAELSYSTRARWALRAIRKYLRLELAPSWRYKILHAHARAIFGTALKAAVISIYIQKHRIIDINATDLWSLEAVTTLLRANPLQMYFFGGQARDFRAWSMPGYVSLSEIVLCGSNV